MKMGPIGKIPPAAYKALCSAFSSKLRIAQLNAEASFTMKKKVELLMRTMIMTKAEAQPLCRQITRNTALNMVAGKVKVAEERRIQWTTFHNLDLWFSTWESTLDEIGFLEEDEFGNKRIRECMLKNILNFDETSLSLDGSTVTRGGRPATVFEDP